MNGMLTHSFVPQQFRFGYMLPIVKDSNGNVSDSSNYRGITISPMLTKIFEHVLKSLFSEYLSTSALQFGFKRKNSTTHAIYCLKQTVDYYINNGIVESTAPSWMPVRLLIGLCTLAYFKK